ncbi:MAG: GFA family protein [Betaproteobacteria bacterium]|nr:GFA family protein [Betaproteobacteria bacterium]
MTADAIAGGCLCGAIRFSIAGAPLALSLCHCLTCRRASSAPSVAWVVVRRSDFAVVSGQPRCFRSSPHVTRTFCGNCGSPLTYRHDDNLDTIDVTTVTLDFPEQFPPTREIWIEHKLGWEALNETTRHYPRDSAGRQ